MCGQYRSRFNFASSLLRLPKGRRASENQLVPLENLHKTEIKVKFDLWLLTFFNVFFLFLLMLPRGQYCIFFVRPASSKKVRRVHKCSKLKCRMRHLQAELEELHYWKNLRTWRNAAVSSLKFQKHIYGRLHMLSDLTVAKKLMKYTPPLI